MSVQLYQLENPYGQSGPRGPSVLSVVVVEAKHVIDGVKIRKEVLHFRVKARREKMK